jgi:hypothetical protein
MLVTRVSTTYKDNMLHDSMLSQVDSY